MHVDFVRSLTLDSWKSEQVALMKAGGNLKCFNSFKASKVPMAVTDGGGRNGLVNDSNDFLERYTHVGATKYKEQLLNEIVPSKSTIENPDSSPTKQLSDEEKDGIYRSARLDPTLAWYKPILPVITKLIALGVQVVFGFPVFPLLLLLGFARFVLYPDNTLLQGICWLVIFIPLVGSFLFGRYLYKTIINDRCPSFKSAQNLLSERIIRGRAIRIEGKYDVFLPSSTDENIHNDKKDDGDDDGTKNKRIGLILYPAPMVNHTAYAQIAAKISDKGNIIVVVMSMEPFRMNLDSVENETKRALQVMYELLDIAPNYPVSEWTIGGHSLGSHVAIKVAKATSPGISKAVLWGCITRPLDYKSSTLSLPTNKIDVLLLNGSEDKSVNSVPERNSILTILPPRGGSSARTIHRTIPGGNHNGFGHYERPKNQKKDGNRTITLDEQQRIAVDETVQFLKGVPRSTTSSSGAVDVIPKSKTEVAAAVGALSSKKNE